MLEVEFREASLLKRLVESLKDISKEVNVFCRYEEITLQTMDESHVALIALQLRADALLRYRCDQECVLGLDVVALHKYIGPFANNRPLILNRVEGEQQVTFVGCSTRQISTSSGGYGKKRQTKTDLARKVREGSTTNVENDNEERNKVDGHEEMKEEKSESSEDESYMRNDNDKAGTKHDDDTKQNMWNRTAKMKLICVEQDPYQTPENLIFKADVCMPCALFSHVVRGNVGVSETMKLTAKPTTLELSVDAELGHTSTILHKGIGPLKNEKEYPWVWRRDQQEDEEDGGSRRTASNDVVEMEVALAYLQKFIKACPISNKMYVSMSPGVPLRLRFPIEVEASKSSYLEFFLAPKVGDPDDEEEMRF